MPTGFSHNAGHAAALILGLMASGSGALARQTATIALPSGGAMRFATRGDLTIVRWSHEIVLQRDSTVAPHSPVLHVRLIAEVPGSFLIVTDAYASKPGGLSYCQAGEEQFLRVLANGKETFHMKLQSCIENLELIERGVTWDAGTSLLRIHWRNHTSVYRVDEQGNTIDLAKQ